MTRPPDIEAISIACRTRDLELIRRWLTDLEARLGIPVSADGVWVQR